MGKSESDELVDDIEQIRLRLASTVDQLVDRAHPKSIASHSLASVRGHFVDAQGSPRFENIVPVAAGAAAVVAALLLVRRLTR